MKTEAGCGAAVPQAIEDLFARSGDSRLLEVRFDGQTATIGFIHGDDERRYALSFGANSMAARIDWRLPGDKIFFFRLGELASLLQVENGTYRPDPGFVGRMRETRDGLHLAYGRRVSRHRRMLFLSGSFELAFLLTEPAAFTLSGPFEADGGRP